MNPQQDTLAEIDDERVRALEHRVFGDIDAVRARRSARRRRTALSVGAAAAVVALAAAIGPALSGGTGFAASSGADSAVVAPESGEVEFQSGGAAGIAEDASAGVSTESLGTDGGVPTEATTADGAVREIVATASATVRTDSVADTLDRIAATAAGYGGYVEYSTSTAVGGADLAAPEVVEPGTDDSSLPSPRPVEGAGAITVRIPADRLTEAIASLDELGTVTASTLDRQDVTTQAIDLRARVAAAQASVERLTTLMAQAGSVADLLTAESALAARQGELESYQQQLTALESQVGLSTLTVSVVPEEAAVATAEPTGFIDGLLAGWNGLVAAVNGTLIGLGFLLPWLAVAGVVGALVVAVRRRRRTPRPVPDPVPSPDPRP